MSVQTQIDRINKNVSDAYKIIKDLGGTIPTNKNSDNIVASLKSIKLETPKIYGVSWPGGTASTMTRTDDAVGFANPVPAVGAGNGSSPFDTIMPWAGMVRVTDGENILVAIPKFWLKVQMNPFRVQISNRPVEGFQVSPAHRDRGDGVGERDVVYVGRYQYATDHGSISGYTPTFSGTIGNFRTQIRNQIGGDYYMYDYSLHLTILYLYIVEFANFDTQASIGGGVVVYPNTNIISNGGTDSMTYHTGRISGTVTSRVAIQYRNIENIWGNAASYCDGILFDGDSVCTYSNPKEYTSTYDDSNASSKIIRSNKRPVAEGYVSAFGYDTNDPSFIFPSTVNASRGYTTGWYNYSSSTATTVLFVGYAFDISKSGLFYYGTGSSTTGSLAGVGARIQKLPS